MFLLYFLFISDKLKEFIKLTHHDLNDRKMLDEEENREEIIKNNWRKIVDAEFATSRERRNIMLEFLENCRKIVYTNCMEVHKSLITGGLAKYS